MKKKMVEKKGLGATIVTAATEVPKFKMENEDKQELDQFAWRADSLVIVNQEDYVAAAQTVKDVSIWIEKIEAKFKKLKNPINEALAAVKEEEKETLAAARNIVEKYRITISKFLTEQRIKDQIEADKKRKIAEAEAEKKRKALRAKLAKAKTEDKKEIIQETIEEIVATPVYEEKTISQNTQLEGGGGISQRKELIVTVENKHALIEAVYKKKVPASILDVKLQKLKSYIAIQELKNREVPGVLIEEKIDISVRKFDRRKVENEK